MSQTSIARQFDYQPRWTSVLRLTVVLWGGLGVVGIVASVWLPPGILKGVFLGAAAGGLIGWFFGLVINVLLLLRPKRSIVLTDDAILLPRTPWSTEETRVEYRAITKVTPERRLGPLGPRTLIVEHPGGKHMISEAMLPSKRDLDEILGFLQERTGRSS